MPYALKCLPDAPILVASWSRDFDYASEIKAFTADLTALLDEQPHPVGLVLDMGSPVLSIADVFDCMKLARQGTESVYFHAQILTVCWVTTATMLGQAAQEVSIPVYADLETALDALRGGV